MQDLPRASLPADDDDGRLRPGIVAAHGGSQLLICRSGNVG